MIAVFTLLFALVPFAFTVPQTAAQVAPVAPQPAMPAPRAQVRAAPLAPAGQHVASAGGHSVDGYTQITINNEKGDLLLVMHGERFTAILDGEVLPVERLVREGDKLTVASADGNALFEVRVDPANHALAYPYDAVAAMNLREPHFDPFSAPGAGGWPNATVWSDDNRKLIGVNTSAVDAALRAQLGLKHDAFLIETVTADMPAGKAGMQPFDVVTGIEGEQGASTERLREVLEAKAAGETLRLTVMRGGAPQELTLTVEEPRRRGVFSSGFAPGAYTYTTADGLQAYGSMAAAEVEAKAAREELLAKLAAVQAETEKLSAAQSGDSARRLAELAMKQAEIANELRTRETAMRDARSYMGVLDQTGDGSRWLMLPKSGDPVGGADRLAQIEERLVKLEALLERLAPPANDKTKSGEASGK